MDHRFNEASDEGPRSQCLPELRRGSDDVRRRLLDLRRGARSPSRRRPRSSPPAASRPRNRRSQAGDHPALAAAPPLGGNHPRERASTEASPKRVQRRAARGRPPGGSPFRATVSRASRQASEGAKRPGRTGRRPDRRPARAASAKRLALGSAEAPNVQLTPQRGVDRTFTREARPATPLRPRRRARAASASPGGAARD
jgi:hypothetical protein